MSADTNKDWKLKLFAILGVILFLGSLVTFFVFGARSITKFILILMEIMLVSALLFGLAYLFWYLFFKKHKFDVNYVNKKRMVDAFTRVKRPELKDLYLSGDKGHSRVLVGAIQGYGRIQVLTRNHIYETVVDEKGHKSKIIKMGQNNRGDTVPQYTLGKEEQDVFVVKTKGIGGMFGSEMVLRVNPEDHDELIGDVTVNGYSLIPIGEYWFLNSDHLDVRKVDYAILKEAERTIAFETMSDMKELIDRATGIDAKHKKQIEAKSLIELPETSTTSN